MRDIFKFYLLILSFLLIFSCNENDVIETEDEIIDNQQPDDNQEPDNSQNFEWIKIGESIQNTINEKFGYSLDLNNVGDKIVIGDPGPSNGCNGEPICSGSVTVFSNNGGNWTQTNQILYGENSLDRFGNSVKISNDGNTIIANANKFEINNNIQISVYENNQNSWIQVGSKKTLIISALTNYSTVNLNADGDIYSTSTPSLNFNTDAIILEKNNQDWEQIGETPRNDLSQSTQIHTSLNSYGDIIAVGKPNQGTVGVFQNTNNSWLQIGQEIFGETNQDSFGAFIKLNNQGNTLIVGAINEPYAKVYKLDGNQWVQKGQKIFLSDNVNFSSYSNSDLSINGDGNRISAEYRNFNDQGHIDERYIITYEYDSQSSLWEQIAEINLIPFLNSFTAQMRLDLNDEGDVLAVGTSDGVWDGVVNVFELVNID